MIPDGDLHTYDWFIWYGKELVGRGLFRVSRKILDRHRTDILTHLNYALEHLPSGCVRWLDTATIFAKIPAITKTCGGFAQPLIARKYLSADRLTATLPSFSITWSQNAL